MSERKEVCGSSGGNQSAGGKTKNKQPGKASIVKTAEDEIFLNRLKAMREADEYVVIFPEDIRSVGLEIAASLMLQLYEFLIKAAENPSEIKRTTLKEELRANLRNNEAEQGIALTLDSCKAYVSFHENPHPLEALRKIFRSPERVVTMTKEEVYPGYRF